MEEVPCVWRKCCGTAQDRLDPRPEFLLPDRLGQKIVGTQVQVLGAAGIVTDGAVRDLEALHRIGMKVWSEHVVVSHGHIDVGRANIPIEVGGLVVHPGDILHADLNGVVSIPHDVLDKLPGVIDEVLANEAATLKRLREEGYDLEAHRKQIEH